MFTTDEALDGARTPVTPVVGAGTKPRRSWTDNEVGLLMGFWEEELTIPEIALRLGRTVQGVTCKIGGLRTKDPGLLSFRCVTGPCTPIKDDDYEGPLDERPYNGGRRNRDCLSCRLPFDSDHNGIRRCQGCLDIEGLDSGFFSNSVAPAFHRCGGSASNTKPNFFTFLFYYSKRGASII